MNIRRRIIFAFGAGALTAPLPSIAQQPAKVWRVGIIGSQAHQAPSNSGVDAITQGMRELGYIEGKNLLTAPRFTEGQYERVPGLVAELLQMKVDVIVATATPVVLVIQRATRTTPIVFVNLNDPVGSGLAASLARPGGNVTGLSLAGIDVSSKHLELLKIMVPRLSRVAVLLNPDNSTSAAVFQQVQASSRMLDIEVQRIEARSPEEIERGFAAMKRERADAVLVMGENFFQSQRERIADLAIRNRLPSIYQERTYVEAGGLMSYGTSYVANWRYAVTYVDKIFKGAKPGDLPIEQPTIFKFEINRKTAKALGLTIPQELLIRADEVIE